MNENAPTAANGRGAGGAAGFQGHRHPNSTATRPIDAVLARLDGAIETRPGEWRAYSPFQEHRRARTLAVKEGDDGRVLLHDFAGRDVRELLEAIGLEFGDLFPGDYRAPNRHRREKAWKPTISPREALHVLSVETLVVMQVALMVVELDDRLTRQDYLRCREAVRRIQAVRGCTR